MIGGRQIGLGVAVFPHGPILHRPAVEEPLRRAGLLDLRVDAFNDMFRAVVSVEFGRAEGGREA